MFVISKSFFDLHGTRFVGSYGHIRKLPKILSRSDHAFYLHDDTPISGTVATVNFVKFDIGVPGNRGKE